uniref:Uncharacterized protein n=1 Tax=Meloidogyne hapla TaxID=6305 RepID=A0A1I8C0L1_MELHA
MNNNNKSSLLKPKVVIIPPSSSSISSSTSSFSLEKKPLISQRNAQLRAKFFGLIPNNEEIIYADEDDLLIFSNGTNNLGRREKHPIRSTQINTPSHPSPSSQQKHQNNSFNHNKFSLNKNKEKWKQFNSLLDCQKCNNCWNRAKAVVHDYISGAVSSVGQNLNKFRHRRNKYWSTSEGTTSSDEEKETKEQIKDTCYCVKKDCGFLYTSSRKWVDIFKILDIFEEFY